MADLGIPEGPQALTNDWLSEALSSETGGAKVTSFDMSTFGEGVGLLGQLVRLTLEYDGGSSSAPRNVVAKFPALAEENRGLATAFSFYKRELDFYKHLAAEAPITTPKSLYQDIEPETQHFVLLMEDVSSAKMGDQIAGATAQQATQAIGGLVEFHAKYWGKTDQLEWLFDYRDADMSRAVQGSYQKAIGPTLEQLPGSFTDAERKTAQTMADNVFEVLSRDQGEPLTVIHGDYRLDNVMFGDEGDITVVDWQISGRGNGTFDVGYHMSQSVPPAVRSKIEKDVVRDYHKALAAQGVTGYAVEDCWNDYRNAVLIGLIYPICTCGALDLSNDRGRALAQMMLDRCLSAMRDTNAAELMPK